LALTALVLFLAMEGVNLFTPGAEQASSQLVTAFMMVLAFYFGSRAVEVLQSRQSAASSASASADSGVSAGSEAPAGSADRGEVTSPVAPSMPVGVSVAAAAATRVAAAGAAPIRAALALEQPLMPAHLEEPRRDSLVVAAGAAAPAAMLAVVA